MVFTIHKFILIGTYLKQTPASWEFIFIVFSRINYLTYIIGRYLIWKGLKLLPGHSTYSNFRTIIGKQGDVGIILYITWCDCVLQEI